MRSATILWVSSKPRDDARPAQVPSIASNSRMIAPSGGRLLCFAILAHHPFFTAPPSHCPVRSHSHARPCWGFHCAEYSLWPNGPLRRVSTKNLYLSGGCQPDWESDQDKTLAARLMALADLGIRDPQELRSRTLKTLPLGRAHYGPSLLLSRGHTTH